MEKVVHTQQDKTTIKSDKGNPEGYCPDDIAILTFTEEQGVIVGIGNESEYKEGESYTRDQFIQKAVSNTMFLYKIDSAAIMNTVKNVTLDELPNDNEIFVMLETLVYVKCNIEYNNLPERRREYSGVTEIINKINTTGINEKNTLLVFDAKTKKNTTLDYLGEEKRNLTSQYLEKQMTDNR